jgi:hypothetical protein
MEDLPSEKEDSNHDRITKESEITYITRRRSLRIPFKMRIKYGLIRNNLYDEHAEPKLGGFVYNLSENGIGIEGLRGLPQSADIHVLLFTGDKTLRLEGKVKWSDIPGKDKCRMGVEFTGHADSIKKMYTKTLFKNRFGI